MNIKDDEFLAWSRFQVGLAVTTGVLVIVITTAAVILLGRAQAPGTALPPRSPSASARTTPAAMPSAVPTETAASPSAKASPSKKPSSPAPAPITMNVTCALDTLPTNESTSCTIALSAAAPVNVTLTISCNVTDVVVPQSVTINAGDKMATIAVLAGQTVGPATITVTMPGNSPKSTTINIFMKQSISIVLSLPLGRIL